MSDLGGVTRVIITAFGLFLYPLSEFNYNRALSKQLYYASTKDKNIINMSDQDKASRWNNNKLVKWNQLSKIPHSYDHEMKESVKKHKI